MAKLGDYWDGESGQYLKHGDHEFTVSKVEKVPTSTGTPYYKLICNAAGGSSEVCFAFKPGNEANIRIFAGFLHFALGIEKANVQKFDTDQAAHWDRLVGKRFMGRVLPKDRPAKDGRFYHEIGEYWAIGQEAPPQPQPAPPSPSSGWADDDRPGGGVPQPTAPPEQAPFGDNATGDDDIPF